MEKPNYEIYSLLNGGNETSSNKMIVRLSRSYWHDHNGAYLKISIKLLKRLSGSDYFLEDCANAGADCLFPIITNLNQCKDGIYELDTCDEHRDWESGYIDDYKYKLIPYVEEVKTV